MSNVLHDMGKQGIMTPGGKRRTNMRYRVIKTCECLLVNRDFPEGVDHRVTPGMILEGTASPVTNLNGQVIRGVLDISGTQAKWCAVATEALEQIGG